jgi:glycosyltransferase involved in cell wall biosynthesis
VEQGAEPKAVTVVMRTRDRPLLLERAVESVVSQTFTDYELVVVNDGGDAEQVEEILARHPAPAPARVTSVHHGEPVGLRSPPNAPIRETASTFVVIHDDDDSWHPAFLERTTAHLEEAGAAGVLARTELVVEEIQGDRVVTLSTEPFHGDLAFVSLYATCFDNVAAPIAFVYRREAYEAVGGYDESLGSVADWDFTLRFLLRHEIDVLHSEEPLAFYRHRPEAGGSDLNSVYSDRHDVARNLMANRYLRDDIAAGRVGLGFALNMLREGYTARESALKRSGRIEAERIEYLASCIRGVDERVAAVEKAVTAGGRLRSDMALVRSIPARLARRLGRGGDA